MFRPSTRIKSSLLTLLLHFPRDYLTAAVSVPCETQLEVGGERRGGIKRRPLRGSVSAGAETADSSNERPR